MAGFFHGSKIKKAIRISNPLIRECFAEFLGTFLLVAMGTGASAANVLPPKLNIALASNIGWGFAACMAMYASAGVTGGHINPAITSTMWVLGRLPTIKVPIYWTSQYLGAVAGAALTFGIYYDGINAFDGGVRAVTGPTATAGIFATYPQPYLSIGSALADQIFGTMLLMIAVMAMTDQSNSPVPHNVFPLVVSQLVTLVGISCSSNCGGALNPARDLGPRVLTAMAGYGAEVFTAYDYFFWVPIIGPHVGSICGSWFYLALVGVHIPDDEDASGVENEPIDVKPQDNINILCTAAVVSRFVFVDWVVRHATKFRHVFVNISKKSDRCPRQS